MAAPRFYVPSVDTAAARVVLPADEAHHLVRVLRLGVGDTVRVFDGIGHEWLARVEARASTSVTVELIEPVAAVAEPPVRITLAVALLKGRQMDRLIRDTTMLGVSEIVPLVTAHVAVPPPGETTAVGRRWHRIAVESAKQCGRAVVPAVRPVSTFEAVLSGAAAGRIVMAVEPAARDPESTGDRFALDRPDHALALVGPEGGWQPAEIEAAVARGAQLVDLGPRTLRAEVAPVVLLSALWAVWGW